MSENNTGFSVLDMAQNYANDENIDVSEIFKNNPVSGNTAKEAGASIKSRPNAAMPVPGSMKGMGTPPPQAVTEAPADQSAFGPPKRQKPKWEPDKKLTEGLADLNSEPVTYTREELVNPLNGGGGLKNIADDNAHESAVMAMDDLGRKNANIEYVKREMGIRKLSIPEGPWHAKIFAAAGDTNVKRALEGVREILTECLTEFPEYITERIDDPASENNQAHGTQQIIDPPEAQSQNPNPLTVEQVSTPAVAADPNKTVDLLSNPPKDGTHPSISSNPEEVKVVIDKTQAPEIAWDKDEIEKIKKSRSIELNIVEDVDLKYTEIEELDENAVDAVLSQYVRKVNDIVGALPASKYRATFTGLTYTEILDLSHSQEMNNLDGERKKWSIAFEHTKNQSIGPWREYKYYIDPDTKKRIEMPISAPDPIDTVRRRLEIIEVSYFDDFLMKTSFMDLEFILWKILCATAMEKEIISIDCHGTYNGSPCKKSYDWVYSPRELLVMESINPAVAEEMKETMLASSIDKINSNYASSMLNKGQAVELTTSKFGCAFGHISAYEYLNEIYAEIRALEDQKNPMLSQALSYSTLTVIKSFLIPKRDAEGNVIGHSRVRGAQNLIRIINQLDEIDWQTISELVRIMLEPYQFQFSLRDIKCPQCKTKSNIDIDDITRLLFIVAQSLSSVQVVLKRT